MTTEFSDRPFVADSVFGYRSFIADDYGRLTGMQYRAIWRPGENTAVCYATPRKDSMSWLLGSPQVATSYGGNLYFTSDPPASPPPLAHSVASLSCSCGFYAYFDADWNAYTEDSHFRAVIEGTGLLTIGTRGFRAPKATIRALIMNNKGGRRVNDRVLDRVRHNYPDVPIFERKRDALAEYPLTEPQIPTPETDADFWTRGAVSLS